MYVGVILLILLIVVGLSSIPHVCGGDPSIARWIESLDSVFPMYVGVILSFR